MQVDIPIDGDHVGIAFQFAAEHYNGFRKGKALRKQESATTEEKENCIEHTGFNNY